VDKALVFGSRAKGNYKEGSDIDLALKGYITAKDLLDLHGKLEALNLPYSFDLVNYNTINEPALKEHVDRAGVEMYSRWKEYKLGDLIDLITKGTTPTTLDGKFVEKGINFIKSEAITYDGRIDKSTFMFIDEVTNRKLKRSQLQKDDILFSMAGIFLGKNAIVTQDLLPANTNQALAIIRLNKQKSLPRYIHYYLRQRSIIDLVNNMSGQSAQPNVNFEEIKSINILLPPLQEQQIIAEALSSLDDKIDLLYCQNKTLEQLAETLFRQWFMDDDRIGTLSEYVKVQGGYAFKSVDFKEKGVAGVIKIKNITMGNIDITNTDFVDENIVKNLDKRFKIKSGNFLIAMTGAEIGKIGIVEKTEKEIWVNQRVGKLEAKIPYGDLIGYLALKSREGQDHIINACAGSAQENISSLGIEEMSFTTYDRKKTNELGKEIHPLFDKIIFNQRQIRALTKLRDTLLPKLMNGEVRMKISSS
jgi:type I restriction enzyme S subunit